MSFALRAALALRQRLGPKAGLAVLRPLVEQLQESERGQAILAALGCARELGDETTYTELVGSWNEVKAAQPFEPLAAEVAAARGFSLPCAWALAQAEAERSPGDARAHYLMARLGGDGQHASYRQALALALRPPVREEYAAMIVASMLSDGVPVEPARIASLPPEAIASLPLPSQLAITRHRLSVTRGYKRLALLDSLMEVLSSEGPHTKLALSIVAEFVDHSTPTAIEWDRLRTAAASRGDASLARFEIWRADRTGEGEGSRLAHDARSLVPTNAGDRSSPKAGSAWSDGSWAWSPTLQTSVRAALQAIAALREGQPVHFDALSDARAPALIACSLGLDVPEYREEALRFAEALLDNSHAKRGWLRLARAVRRQSSDTLETDLDTRLIERAFACEEPGARAALVDELKTRAWALAHRRDKESDLEALALLERARGLSRP